MHTRAGDGGAVGVTDATRDTRHATRDTHHPSLVERYALPPPEIERRSLAWIEARLGEALPADPAERVVAKRLIYAAGDLALAPLIRFAPGAVVAAVGALRAGSPLVTDVQMVAVALNRRLAAQLGCPIRTAIDEPAVVARARASDLPRAVEAMRYLAADGALEGAGVVIGNAPTALLALLDLVDGGTCRPAWVVGMPVGFVAAAESKAELMRRPLPWLSVEGTRGGSPLAAAAANALLALAAEGASP